MSNARQLRLWFKAAVGEEILFCHPSRMGKLKGVVEDVIFELKDRKQTYYVSTTTKEGKPCFLNVEKENIIKVIATP